MEGMNLLPRIRNINLFILVNEFINNIALQNLRTIQFNGGYYAFQGDYLQKIQLNGKESFSNKLVMKST